jgi:hypothetical protein
LSLDKKTAVFISIPPYRRLHLCSKKVKNYIIVAFWNGYIPQINPPADKQVPIQDVFYGAGWFLPSFWGKKDRKAIVKAPQPI